MNSRVSQGIIGHKRYAPREHKFDYKAGYYLFDIEEFEELSRSISIFSYQKFNLVSFYPRDYLTGDGDSIKSMMRDKLKELGQEIDFEKTRVFMLTNPRYLGFVFNPLTMYFFTDRESNQLLHTLAEVANTPWNERHWYFHTIENTNAKTHHFENEKDFHVSPFMPMNMRYKWTVQNDADRMFVKIENYQEQGKVFEAYLNFFHQECKNRNVVKMFLKFPFMTGKVLFGIYWQALLLFAKRTPFFDHPNTSQQEVTE